MQSGCLSEFELFRVFRHELAPDAAEAAMHHVLGCELCHDQWRRFIVDERVAEGIRATVVGDVAGADQTAGLGEYVEFPEDLAIPGFKLESRFIEGGQARVYRALHEASQEEVAIKVFHNSVLNEGGRVRFFRELKSLARLRHPHVVPIRSEGEVLGHAYLVMPWIEGPSITEFVQSHRTRVRDVVAMMAKVCSAIDHAHKRGVMHLDLKPSNVRVDSSGEPVVMDFGLARLIDVEASDAVGASLGIAGTPAYMAPEQVSRREEVDIRADVYALGLLLYETLSGRRARNVDPQDAQSHNLQLAAQSPAPIRSVAPRVRSEPAAIVGRTLAADPDKRYQTAGALEQDLRRYLSGDPVEAKAGHKLYHFVKFCHRRFGLLMSAVAILVVLLTTAQVRRFNQRVETEAFVRLDRVIEQRHEATVRELARIYEQLADAYDRLGEKELATMCRERAAGRQGAAWSSDD